MTHRQLDQGNPGTLFVQSPVRQGAVHRFFRAAGLLVLVALAAGFGAWVLWLGRVQALELLLLGTQPITPSTALMPGPALVTGQVHPATTGRHTVAPRSQRACLYYRYTVEERVGSGKNASWSKRHDSSDWVPMKVYDGKGWVELAFHRTGPTWHALMKLEEEQRTDGRRYRYREERIDLDDTVQARGVVELKDGAHRLTFPVGAGADHWWVSNLGWAEEVSSLAVGAYWGAAGGVALLALAIVSFAVLIRMGKPGHFLLRMSVLLAGVLFYLGLDVGRAALSQAAAQHRELEAATVVEIRDALARHGQSWNGQWLGLGDFTSEAYAQLPPAERERLRELRLTVAGSARALDRARGFAGALAGLSAPPAPPLPPSDLMLLQTRESQTRPPRFSLELTGLLAGVAGLTALGLTWWALRRLRLPAIIGRVYARPASQVDRGYVSVRGTIEMPEGATPLAPAFNSQLPAVWFNFERRELRGSGKNASWATIEKREGRSSFVVRDASGAVAMSPAMLQVETEHETMDRVDRLADHEWLLLVGDRVQVFGAVGAERDPEGRAVLGPAGPGRAHFFATNLPLAQAIYRLVLLPYWLLALAAVLIAGAGGALAGLDGRHGPDAYLAMAAAVALWALITGQYYRSGPRRLEHEG